MKLPTSKSVSKITLCYPIKTHKTPNCKINSMAKLLLRGYDYKSAKLCGTKNEIKHKLPITLKGRL